MGDYYNRLPLNHPQHWDESNDLQLEEEFCTYDAPERGKNCNHLSMCIAKCAALGGNGLGVWDGCVDDCHGIPHELLRWRK